MKKIVRILALLSIVLVFAVTSSNAQEIVIGVRPNHVMGRRPDRPSRDHVWVADEWTPSGGTYVVREGHWEVPPRHGAVWVEGHWKNHPRGYVWVPGHWR
jgi:hypothetical protein